MDEIAKLRHDAGIKPSEELREGRVFNNTGEMLRSLLNDVGRVSKDIEDGASELDDVKFDLNDLIEYYRSAEVKQARY